MPGSRFGTSSLFGTTTTFGAGANPSNKLFTESLEIDWDGDGLFNGFNEATNRLQRWSSKRGREFFFNSGGDGFQPVKTGEIIFTLKNVDRRYDPYYTSGSLFNYLQSNPKCRFRLLDNATGTPHDEFYGYVTDVRPHYGIADTVDIVVNDGVLKLKNANIATSQVYTTVQYDAQITLALQLAGYLDGMTIDATLSDTMPYHWFSGRSAFTEINSLIDAVFGLFFVAKDGKATYKSRISSDISVLTLTDADIDYTYGIQAPAPRDVIKNIIKIYARSRTAQNVELWRMVDKPLLVGSSTGSPIWANYSYNFQDVPATAVTEPVATTDYTAFANADGTGTDYTANISWTRTPFATSSKLVPVNSGASAYLTLMKLRGTAITSDNYTYVTEQSDTSIKTFGERELTIKSDWLQDINTATEQAALLLDRFKTLRLFPRIKIKRSKIDYQLTPDLFDLVSVNFVSRNITGEMRIGYIERSWNINESNVIDTVFYLEPNLTISSAGAWIFPVTLPATFG